jgi:hypothetical protein
MQGAGVPIVPVNSLTFLKREVRAYDYCQCMMKNFLFPIDRQNIICIPSHPVLNFYKAIPCEMNSNDEVGLHSPSHPLMGNPLPGGSNSTMCPLPAGVMHIGMNMLYHASTLVEM